MNPPLIAYHREPLNTMERRPIPPHVAAQGPCGHCGSRDPARWRIHRVDGTWMCECFWYPERRPRYRVPEAEQPRFSQAGKMIVLPVKEAEIEEMWWTQ